MPGGRRPQNTRAKLQRDWMTAHRTGSIPVCYSARSYPRTRTRPLEKQAISLLSLPADGMAVVRCFQRKRGPEGRFVAKTGPEQANPSTAFRNAKTPRTAPQTPGKAQKRPRLRALHNVERSFHQTTLVEETRAMNKHSPSVDEVGEFADGSARLTLAHSYQTALPDRSTPAPSCHAAVRLLLMESCSICHPSC